MGDKILVFYGYKPPSYAVYRTDKRVVIQYADDPDKAASQRKPMAQLNPVRGEITNLIDGWRKAKSSAQRLKAERYDRRVGDALILAFEDDLASADYLLKEVKQDIIDERTSLGRFIYLVWALGTALGFGLLIALASWLLPPNPVGVQLWRAGATGALGAFFSVALAIKSRTVLPDLQHLANAMDAVLRMTIGVIAAAVLAALIMVDAIKFSFGNMSYSPTGPHNILYVLVIGFVAGFSERFVPDLLAKASAATQSPAMGAASSKLPGMSGPLPVGSGGVEDSAAAAQTKNAKVGIHAQRRHKLPPGGGGAGRLYDRRIER